MKRQERHEFAFRAKLVFALSALGAFIAALAYLHVMIFKHEPRELADYARAIYRLFTLDMRGIDAVRTEFLTYALAGAAAGGGVPLLIFARRFIFSLFFKTGG